MDNLKSVRYAIKYGFYAVYTIALFLYASIGFYFIFFFAIFIFILTAISLHNTFILISLVLIIIILARNFVYIVYIYIKSFKLGTPNIYLIPSTFYQYKFHLYVFTKEKIKPKTINPNEIYWEVHFGKSKSVDALIVELQKAINFTLKKDFEKLILYGFTPMAIKGLVRKIFNEYPQYEIKVKKLPLWFKAKRPFKSYKKKRKFKYFTVTIARKESL